MHAQGEPMRVTNLSKDFLSFQDIGVKRILGNNEYDRVVRCCFGSKSDEPAIAERVQAVPELLPLEDLFAKEIPVEEVDSRVGKTLTGA